MNGKMHGFGTFVWADGEKYTGSWTNNVRDGQGTLVTKDGDKKVLLFANGEQQ